MAIYTGIRDATHMIGKTTTSRYQCIIPLGGLITSTSLLRAAFVVVSGGIAYLYRAGLRNINRIPFRPNVFFSLSARIGWGTNGLVCGYEKGDG